MSALAESVGYNKNYLSTKFSREVGVSLSDYLARLRVERAKLALRNTSEKSAAEALLPKVTSMLDKLAKHNIIHKNKAGNLKSKLAKHVNALA